MKRKALYEINQGIYITVKKRSFWRAVRKAEKLGYSAGAKTSECGRTLLSLKFVGWTN